MDPYAPREPCAGLRRPRLRGDGPRRSRHSADRPEAPPPTRGWTCGRRISSPTTSGAPAYAGMDPDKVRIGRAGDRRPRLRGDGPFSIVRGYVFEEAPPPTRGWTLVHRREDDRIAGAPAYAGMDRASPISRPRSTGRPRLRGDGLPPTPIPSSRRIALAVDRFHMIKKGARSTAWRWSIGDILGCRTIALPRPRGDRDESISTCIFSTSH
jgi:hypothetical protein